MGFAMQFNSETRQTFAHLHYPRTKIILPVVKGLTRRKTDTLRLNNGFICVGCVWISFTLNTDADIFFKYK